VSFRTRSSNTVLKLGWNGNLKLLSGHIYCKIEKDSPSGGWLLY
jgi:hypothetical protein